MPFSPDKHNTLHALATAATQPGPWTVKRTAHVGTYTVLDAHGMWVADVGAAPKDAAFIAACSPEVVLELLDDNVGLRMGLDLAYGPHCSSCGNPIDPDTCHCGQSAEQHGGEYHGFCPMGCSCGFEPNWEVLAKSRGDLVGKLRRELAEITKAHDEACGLLLDRLDDGPLTTKTRSRVVELLAVGKEQP